MKTTLKALLAAAVMACASLAHAAAVNLNSASANELAEALSGIGLTKAEAIVSFRDTNGAFLSVEDLVRVKGIGDALLERNRENLVLE